MICDGPPVIPIGGASVIAREAEHIIALWSQQHPCVAFVVIGNVSGIVVNCVSGSPLVAMSIVTVPTVARPNTVVMQLRASRCDV